MLLVSVVLRNGASRALLLSSSLALSVVFIHCTCDLTARMTSAPPGMMEQFDYSLKYGLQNVKYRVTRLLCNNLPLTWFRQFRQLLGCYCSYLLPRQDGGTFQIQVNGRLLPRRLVTLYFRQNVQC